MGLRTEGDAIVLLDGRNEVKAVNEMEEVKELSSSAYAKVIAGIVAGAPPAMDIAAEKRLIECLAALAAEEAIRSAHDVSDGGLATTLAECCFASQGLSARVTLAAREPAEAALFGERGARAVVSVAQGSIARVLAIARQYPVAAQEIGQVTGGGEFRIEWNAHTVIRNGVSDLRDAWANSIERTLRSK
jgi:phosphoribosylformylglycinamidine synthase